MALIKAMVKLTLPNGKVVSTESNALNANLILPGQEAASISSVGFLDDFGGVPITSTSRNTAVLTFDVLQADPGAKIKFYISGWDAWPTHRPEDGGGYTLSAPSTYAHVLAGGNLTSIRRTDVQGYNSNEYTLNLPNGVSYRRNVAIKLFMSHTGAAIPSPTANIVLSNRDAILAQIRMKLLNILN